mmetsp:Transcript_29662/g.39437  ORF Transcript_29662/g.39437 Transcript_29662/m.39437 type:complete len:93 (+) Transcript_29662:55-333(+)
MGSALMLGAASAFLLYRRRQVPRTWRDPHFKSENLALYSEEAKIRAQQLSNVSYRLVVNLSDSEEQGYEGAFRTSFSLKERPSEDNPLFLDF